MQTTRPAAKRLADVLLGESVEAFIAERRAAGRSYRMVARDLLQATGGQVDVTEATVRAWALAGAPEAVSA